MSLGPSIVSSHTVDHVYSQSVSTSLRLLFGSTVFSRFCDALLALQNFRLALKSGHGSMHVKNDDPAEAQADREADISVVEVAKVEPTGASSH